MLLLQSILLSFLSLSTASLALSLLFSFYPLIASQKDRFADFPSLSYYCNCFHQRHPFDP